MDEDLESGLVGDEEELLARIAWYYYNDGLTQGEVGERLGLSRIKISRLLERGRQTGLIQVQINSPFEGCFRLQAQLTARYGLKDARVIPALDSGRPSERVSQAAVQMLMRHLSPNDLLAVGWGETAMATVRRLAPTLARQSIALVGLTGGVATYMDGIGFSGHANNVHLIPAPLRVSSPSFAEALRLEPHVRHILEMARTAKAALIGIGALTRDATIVRNGYCTPAEFELFRRQGAVGDVLGYFYDAEGRILDLDLHRHIVAVDPQQLRMLPLVIGAAAGLDKVQATRAALRGGLVTALVTDETTATEILREEE